MADAIQFRGMQQVIDAFENRGVECWSLWFRKQFLNKGTGSEPLQSFLEMIKDNGSNAIYTLKVYEDIDDPKKIKSNTPDDGSFNFRLDTLDDMQSMGSPYLSLTRGPMAEKISSLEKKLDLLLLDPPEDKEEETIGSIFMTLLKNPSDLAQLISIFRPQQSSPPVLQSPIYNSGPVAAMGNVQTDNSYMENLTDEQLQQRLTVAMDILGKNDPKIIEHLEKLAKLSDTNPGLFKMLLLQLEAVK